MRNDKLAAPVELQIPAGIRYLFDDPPVPPSEDPQGYWDLVSLLAEELKPSGLEWLWVQDVVLHTMEIRRLWAVKHCIINRELDMRAKALADEADRQERSSRLEKLDGETIRSVGHILEALSCLKEYCQKTPEFQKYVDPQKAPDPEKGSDPHKAKVCDPQKDSVCQNAGDAGNAPEPQTSPDAQNAPDLQKRSEEMRRETELEPKPKLDTEADYAQAFVGFIDEVEKLDRLITSHERGRDRALREIELHREIRIRRPREVHTKLLEVEDSKAPVAPE